MPLTKKEQIEFEKMVRERCKAEGTPGSWIKKVADFLFEMTGDVNWRMSVANKFDKKT